MADRMSPVRRRALLDRAEGAANRQDLETLEQVASEDVPALAADVGLLEEQMDRLRAELAKRCDMDDCEEFREWLSGEKAEADKRSRQAEAERDRARDTAVKANTVLGEQIDRAVEAEAERDQLTTRVEHLKERVAELSEFEAGIKSLTAADGTIDMSLSLAHDLMRIYVASFVEILDAADAPNFVELMFKLAGTTDRYTVTIRRPGGQTPGEVLGKLRVEHEQLVAQRNAVIDLTAREQNDAAADVQAGGPAAQLEHLTVPVHDLLVAVGVITPDTAPEPAAPEPPLIDPDCRDGKCGSCVGGPCEHSCHTVQNGDHTDG